jgi:DNA repair exonuclease SbcCD nuclease subunit
VQMAMEPLVKVANHGVPVYIVPGNHERSKIPLRL